MFLKTPLISPIVDKISQNHSPNLGLAYFFRGECDGSAGYHQERCASEQ